MKFQKVFYGIVLVFMIVTIILLFQIQGTVDNIKSSADNNRETIDSINSIKMTVSDTNIAVYKTQSYVEDIDLTIRNIKPTVDYIKTLCLGIPLLMRPR